MECLSLPLDDPNSIFIGGINFLSGKSLSSVSGLQKWSGATWVCTTPPVCSSASRGLAASRAVPAICAFFSQHKKQSDYQFYRQKLFKDVYSPSFPLLQLLDICRLFRSNYCVPGSMPSAAIVNCCGLLMLFPHHQAAGAKAESFSLIYSPRIRQSSLGACCVDAETNTVGSRKNKGRFSLVSTVEQFQTCGVVVSLFVFTPRAQFNELISTSFLFPPFPFPFFLPHSRVPLFLGDRHPLSFSVGITELIGDPGQPSGEDNF